METKYYMVKNSICMFPLRKVINNEEYFWDNRYHKNIWVECFDLGYRLWNKSRITEEEAFRYILEN